MNQYRTLLQIYSRDQADRCDPHRALKVTILDERFTKANTYESAICANIIVKQLFNNYYQQRDAASYRCQYIPKRKREFVR